MASSTNDEPNQDSSAAATGEVIATSQDLMSQILLQLPATLIAESKLVSKQWLSISSDPNFIASHTLHHPPLPSGLFLSYFARPARSGHEYVLIDQNDDDHGPRQFVAAQNSLGLNILQSCNGLLLCSSSNTEFYICNPTTLQRKKLALPKGAYPGSDFALNLAFDPKTSLQYKVICVRRLLGQQSRYQIEVCSTETSLWRKVGEPFTEHNVIDFKRGVFCNGAVHWLKTNSSCLYFDINKEIMKSTPEPPPHMQVPFRSHNYEYFGQSNGQLYFVAKNPLPDFTLLKMKDDYSGWEIKYFIDLNGLATKHPSMARNFHSTPLFYPHYECNVLCIAREEENEEIVVSMPGEIVSINPYTNGSKKIADLVLRPHDGSFWYKDFAVHEYIRTLCPV